MSIENFLLFLSKREAIRARSHAGEKDAVEGKGCKRSSEDTGSTAQVRCWPWPRSPRGARRNTRCWGQRQSLQGRTQERRKLCPPVGARGCPLLISSLLREIRRAVGPCGRLRGMETLSQIKGYKSHTGMGVVEMVMDGPSEVLVSGVPDKN